MEKLGSMDAKGGLGRCSANIAGRISQNQERGCGFAHSHKGWPTKKNGSTSLRNNAG